MLNHLRRWQRDAFVGYQNACLAGARALLWEATPGSGKTSAALEVIRHQLEQKLSSKALVVVPTSHLKIQWARAAAQKGLHFDSNFGGDRTALNAEFHGAVVTYQQFGNQIELFRKLSCKSVVILDEVHHTGDGLTWGDAVQVALTQARFILCLSGTAFRSDNNPIPFVTYDDTKTSVPDYSYNYADAVRDRVCRPVAVFTYGGNVSWSEGEQVYTAAFSDKIDPTNSAKRLRAALDPAAGWIQPLLRDAHEMLTATRLEHPNAGGLLVCADQTHARKLAQVLTEITREKPTLVLSDDAEASKKIKKFADDNSSWLVACNMVSEGVDIPRLRIGVYATTIRTKMYFRQFVGRIVRRQAHISGLQIAYLYIPADPTLHFLAQEIESESRHIISTPKESLFGDDERQLRNDAETVEKTKLIALTSINSGVNAVIVQGSQLALFENDVSTSQLARTVVDREIEQQLSEQLTRSEIKGNLSTEIKNLVGLVHRRTRKTHSEIHMQLNREQGVRSQTYCSELQLEARKALLQCMLRGKPLGGKQPSCKQLGKERVRINAA